MCNEVTRKVTRRRVNIIFSELLFACFRADISADPGVFWIKNLAHCLFEQCNTKNPVNHLACHWGPSPINNGERVIITITPMPTQISQLPCNIDNQWITKCSTVRAVILFGWGWLRVRHYLRPTYICQHQRTTFHIARQNKLESCAIGLGVWSV